MPHPFHKLPRSPAPVLPAPALALALVLLAWPVASLAALVVNKTQDLSFGAVVPGSSAGTVVLTAAGGRSKDGGVFLFTQTGTVQVARFTVSGGPPNAVCTIGLPADGTVSVTRTGGGSMALTAFTTDAVDSEITLDGSGNYSGGFSVGATLNVLANQTPGSYGPNTFTVSVNCP